MALCVVRLNERHDVNAFDCGNGDLNNWLQTIAHQHQKKMLSKTYVLLEEESSSVILGFYALAIRGLVDIHLLPPSLAKKLPNRIPGFTLARLGVSRMAQQHGHGKRLLFDALRRAKNLSVQAGGVALFVDAKDEAAASFYARYGFQAFPSNPLTLVMPLAMVTDVLG